MRNIVSAFTLLCLCGVVSCSSAGTEPGPQTTIEPRLSVIQQQIFGDGVRGSCALASCHGGNAGGMNLSPGNSFKELVLRKSQIDSTLYRVNPGNPDSSVLYIKITMAQSTGRFGSPMPQGGPMLSEKEINAIRTWIANGAHND